MASTRLVLVRHAESEWNAQGRLQGQGGTGLSNLGHRQAAALSLYLQQRFPRVDLVVASDLQRVTETAAPWLARVGLDVRVDKQWREIDVGTWSGLTWAEVQAQDPRRYAAWRDGSDVRRGGGETFAEFRVRTAAAMAALRGAGETVIVFTHGGSVRFAVAAALDLPPMGEVALAPVGNCSVTEVLLTDGTAALAAYNTPTGH